MKKDNWTKVKLREVAELNPYKIDKNFQFKEIEYFDISSVGTGYIEKPKIIKFKEAPSRAKRLVGEENIILSTVRPNRRSFYYFKQVKKNYVVSTGFAVIKAKEKIFPRFLYYLVSDINFTNYLIKNAKGSAYPAVDEEIINNAIFCIPQDVKEQQKIAAVLSAYDELIEINNRRIEILEEMAEAIYKEWFVHFRYPGYEKVKMVDSEVGKIPEGWKIKELSAVTEFISRGPSLQYVKEGGIPVLNQKSIRNEKIQLEAIKYAKELSKQNEKYYVKISDILINSMGVGTLGRVARNLHIKNKMIIHNCITVLRAKETIIDKNLLFYRVRDNKNYFENIGMGTTGQTSLKLKDIKKLKILIPPIDIQVKVKHLFDYSSSLKGLYQEINENLKETRDMLLPKLISGKIDVSDLDIKVEEKK